MLIAKHDYNFKRTSASVEDAVVVNHLSHSRLFGGREESVRIAVRKNHWFYDIDIQNITVEKLAPTIRANAHQ